MRPQYAHIKILFLALLIILSSSCSTKKKSWFHRQYHNTSAKYNGYFNGNESLNEGVKKLHAQHIDDYTSIISVFPTGNLKQIKKTGVYMDKAIQKGSVVIQRHSIKIKGREYCRWIDDNYLMVGKAYFYKGDFIEAIKTFKFIKNEYEKNEIYFDACIWLARTYVEKGDFTLAKTELEELFKNKKFPNKLNKDLSLVAADFYVQNKDFNAAVEELKSATEQIRFKRKKVRLNYILAQIYQLLQNYPLAQKHYEIVLRSNPEYDMAFSAKMNLARSLGAGSSDTKKMRDKLLKMIKDDKNKEYLDQIYFTIAEMDMSNQDTTPAIKNYILSTNNSVENNSQKALSFLALAEIYFAKKLYKSAKTYYDSTVVHMEKNFRLYEETNSIHLVLSDLVAQINTIEHQDSLQMVAKLPKSEQNTLISKIIRAETDKERREQEENSLKQQMMYQSRMNGGLGEQFGNKTSGGKWYFYNPATLSFGISEFRKKWGDRKLADDWRRKNKKSLAGEGEDVQTKDTSLTVTQNKKQPGYYLNQLPKTKEDFIKSNDKIKIALYQLGLMYKEDLNEMKLSSDVFENIFKRFPEDDQYAPLGLYNCYINLLEIKDPGSRNIKTILLSKYPKSIYAKIIEDPSENLEHLKTESLVERRYTEVFSLYNRNMFSRVLIKTSNISNEKHKDKLLLLRAFSLIKTNELDSAERILTQISNQEEDGSSDEGVLIQARHILEAIKDPSKMAKANELANAGLLYLYRPKNKHMVVLVLPKKDVDITYLKTLISDFHRQKISSEAFEISALLLGVDQHLLMVQDFSTLKESMEYYNLLLSEEKVQDALKKSEYKMMSIALENFPEFYKNKDVDGYYKFFINNYFIN